MDTAPLSPDRHPFRAAPHRTILALSIPVMLSLVAEPLTGLVDTAFVKELGETPAAALGVGTMLLSAVFWMFGFLGIGTQTQTAHAHGRGDPTQRARLCGLALVLAAAFGVALATIGLLGGGAAASLMGASGEVHATALTYLHIRLLAAPAVLLTIAAFGVLRGVQDMRTPLWIAAGQNALNLVLDWLLIFGAGPIPAFGIAGAAWASTVSQWLGALWAIAAVRQRVGAFGRLRTSDARRLLRVGADLFVRTGLLTLFLLLTTRTATQIGDAAGAAHQGIRMFWLFAALALDAFAASAQSLVGFFLGAALRDTARRVAAVACQWSFATGIALAVTMLAARGFAAEQLAPIGAQAVFAPAWIAAAAFQPLNALSFATDGVHWGTGDFHYLRNVMIIASAFGIAALWLLDATSADALTHVWIVVGGWITIRAVLGIVRIWPGGPSSPLR